VSCTTYASAPDLLLSDTQPPRTLPIRYLIAQRQADDGQIIINVDNVSVEDLTTESPKIRYTTSDGSAQQLECDYVAGCDGSQTYCRYLIPAGEVRKDFFRQYPFAWLGILAQAPPDATDFDLRRQLAEPDAVTSTVSGSTFLAQNYVGLPLG
jgi:2-polyprenyl-6-methoxyphenol hydroxylase-like FAD-dependent oxidoreductase